MRRISWLMVAVLLVVIGAQVARRNEDTQTKQLRAALEDLPLSDAEREQAVDAFEHRDDPQPPEDVSDYVLHAAKRHELKPGGRVTVRVGLSEGAWTLYDRRRLERFASEPLLRSLDAALASPKGVGVAGGVLTVSACQSGLNPLVIRHHRRPAGRADFEIDMPTGEAAIQDNGDGNARSLVAMPPGRYSGRVTTTASKDCARQRFTLDLWPR